MLPARITFLRHGQCAANAERRVTGQLDSPLTALGVAQARQAARTLAARGLTDVAVISSDLARARETARAVADALGVPFALDPGLREQHFGVLEGRPYADLAPEQTPDGLHVNEVRWGGGESVADVHARLARTLERIGAAHRGPVVLVTHGHVIDIARTLLAGGGPREVEWRGVPNGGLLDWP